MKNKFFIVTFALVSIVFLAACTSESDNKPGIADTTEIPAVEKSSLTNLEKNENYVNPDSDLAVFVDRTTYNQILSGIVVAVDDSTITLSKEEKQLIIKRDSDTKYFDASDPNSRQALDGKFLKIGDAVIIMSTISPNTGETVDLVINVHRKPETEWKPWYFLSKDLFYYAYF